MVGKRTVLTTAFFNRPTPSVARDLLGKFLVRRYRGKKMARMITEVEVYDGFSDRGSHAYRGKTARNAPMFGPPGYWYVYLTYGMHWMLNIVTREDGYPAAVLIRSIASPQKSSAGGQKREDICGPGRVTSFFHLDGRFCGRLAAKDSGLWIEDRGIRVPQSCITRHPRVGIHYAGPYWSRRRLRFSFQR